MKNYLKFLVVANFILAAMNLGCVFLIHISPLLVCFNLIAAGFGICAGSFCLYTIKVTKL